MELYTAQSLSNLPKIFTSNPTILRLKTPFTLQQPQIPSPSRRGSSHSLPRATIPEESWSGASLYASEERNNAVVIEFDPPSEKEVYNENRATEGPLEESPVDEQNDFLANLNTKLDSEDTYSILLYGSGALVAVWLASAVVSAINSIPLFPKLMEVVGLGYTIWFTTRYLLFKKSRDELAAKVEELKQHVLGFSDN
ncbi:protein CURVATURE THYLAKOID 1D, chloroplastic isoform X2 [Manihot esculenta]|uniref:protein CURVATURE THYLAKOID 1D, chloroplastic isoform X2 n=1 Tax=Manihot esculenta TaxID=3983 RepID=UPI000B5D190C|nr:protein CURVATURE THYLAKOID 1D, chloroplastic isoform X2 [Manihot esculenta]